MKFVLFPCFLLMMMFATFGIAQEVSCLRWNASYDQVVMGSGVFAVPMSSQKNTNAFQQKANSFFFNHFGVQANSTDVMVLPLEMSSSYTSIMTGGYNQTFSAMPSGNLNVSIFGYVLIPATSRVITKNNNHSWADGQQIGVIYGEIVYNNTAALSNNQSASSNNQSASSNNQSSNPIGTIVFHSETPIPIGTSNGMGGFILTATSTTFPNTTGAMYVAYQSSGLSDLNARFSINFPKNLSKASPCQNYQ